MFTAWLWQIKRIQQVSINALIYFKTLENYVAVNCIKCKFTTNY